MGRGRGKGRKLTVTKAREDLISGDEEPLPARRGRPQKPLMDEIDEEETEKIQHEEEDEKPKMSSKDIKSETVETGKKRKLSVGMKESSDSANEENGSAGASAIDDSFKYISFRQNGNRRKNTPRRAAEAGVDCT